MPKCVGLVRYRTCSGIVSFFHSGSGLTGFRKVRHSVILKVYKSVCVLVHVLVYVFIHVHVHVLVHDHVLVHGHVLVHVHVHDHDNEPVHVHVHGYGQEQRAFNMLSDVHK
jgi:hypothetical protein